MGSVDEPRISVHSLERRQMKEPDLFQGSHAAITCARSAAAAMAALSGGAPRLLAQEKASLRRRPTR